MKKWTIVAGPSSQDFARLLSDKLQAPLIKPLVTYFPDGESKIRIDEEAIDGKDVALVQSIYPPVDRHLVQLLFLAGKLTEMGANVVAITPYLGYARQDKEFLKGEIVSLKSVANLMAATGIKGIATVDIHNANRMGIFSMPAFNCSAVPLLAEYVSNADNLKDVIAVSPDIGSKTRVEAFASVLGCDHLVFQKSRDRITGEIEMEGGSIDLKGRDAVIIDDVISTGSTIVKCTQILKKAGAGRVVAACTHPLLTEGAEGKMAAVGVDEIIATNTIPSQCGKVDVSSLFLGYLESL